ncbi:hypothetical protein L596_015250 [Steinernema carpocapsae]|uniref:Apple domain-containing protein n=1 Tax=Steinernema carpocapsae TaxID=34508 RepID=A0A4U5NFD1_STECR|nr:hypothetical protein L596_015250 [Steinernema carpocapsae]
MFSEDKFTLASTDHDPKLKVRVTNLEDIVKPRADARMPSKQMSVPSTDLQKLVNMTGVKTVTTNGKIVIDDGGNLTEVRVNETARVAQDQVEKLLLGKALKDQSSEKETEPIVLKNGKIVAIKNETRLIDQEGKTSVEKTIEKVERILEAVASGADLTDATAQEGFLNRLVIEGISKVNVGKPKEKVESEQNGDSGHISVVHRPKPRACFDTAPKQMLNGAEFKMLSNVTLDECRCACAKTHIEDEKIKCRSLQYTTEGDCSLNKDDHNGKFDLVYDRISEYQFIKCATHQLMEVGRKKCYKGETKTTMTTEASVTTEEVSKDPTTAWSTAAPTTSEGAEENTTEATTALTGSPQTETPTEEPSTVSAEVTPVPTDSTESQISASGETSTPTKGSEEESMKSKSRASSTIGTTLLTTETQLPITHGKCFEVIDGYLTKSLAGGLEHDISLEECECYCANSIASGRYAFQCQSAIYYHDERDCVLNLDSRKVRPELFVESSDYNVTYLGMTCVADEATSALVDHSKKHGCLGNRKTTTKAPTTPQPPKPTTGENTDNCFLELPHYVLEGNALAIETNVSVEECKCFCVDADYRYGSECQSVQYYYDSMTCLLNKENRISNPDRFNYAHGSVIHSYFDFRCQAEQTTLSVYVEQVCKETINHDETVPPTTKKVSEEDDKSTDEGSMEVPSGKKSEATTQTRTDSTMEEITFQRTTPSTTDSMDELKFETTKEVSSTSGMEKIQFESTKATQAFKKPSTKQFTDSSKASSTSDSPFITMVFETSNAAASEEEDDRATSSLEEETTVEAQTTPSTTPSTTTVVPKTAATKKPHIAELEETTEEKVTRKITKVTTHSTTTTTTSAYEPVGPCRYSALYQTVFQGTRLIKRIVVSRATSKSGRTYM